ncbi:EF-hand domain-containing protein [Lutibacter citreus]|uniref:EF-hand domain-containing protein n=1 Tax=Lutibacter citreus TaxID=2138210 RepID=UPI000DBE28A3|nr:EF-hand domain-containing protein [Lutibacter citreus]
MKILKGTIVFLGLLAFTSVNAQDTKEKAEKKLGWMDKDKDNSISKEEMIAFYDGKKNKKGEPVNGEEMFIGSDQNNDGKVTVDELQKKVNWKKVNSKKAAAKKIGKAKSSAKKAVKKSKLPDGKAEKKLYWMDKDKNGSVSLDEMKSFFKGKKDKKGEAMNAENIFYGTDANDDGTVNLEELKKGINWKKVNAKNKI